MYSKRAGPSLHGQLYETKLLSLILFRAQHDHNIQEFHLASNLDKAGSFDDICLKAKIKGYDQPLIIFLETRYTTTDRMPILNNLVRYFKSYLEIKENFNRHRSDVFFNEIFDNTECLFILYTNAKGNLKRDCVKSPFYNHLHNLISTSMVDGSQMSYTDEDVQLLETELLKDEMKMLAQHLAKFIFNKHNQIMMMNDEYILRYHVILARNVLNIVPENTKYNVCTFRDDFFTTTDEHLSLFKEELCQNVLEIVHSKNKSIQQSEIYEFLSAPTETTLRNVIGRVVTLKNNKLKFIINVPDKLKIQLSLINLPRSTINKAIETLTVDTLKKLQFKVPFIFGNTDLVLSGDKSMGKKRLHYLASTIVQWIEQSKPSLIITIDETMPERFLQLKGGLAGAIGNLLVFDEDSGLLKFTDNSSLLKPNAKTLLTEISNTIDDLQKYKIAINVRRFPKLKIRDRINQTLVTKFLNKFLLWTDQASQEEVEEILKEEIENYESSSNRDFFRLKSEAIFLKYHDNICKWWMSSDPHYLTKNTNTYQQTVHDIISNPLIRITSMIYMKNLSSSEYSFKESALNVFTEKFSKTIQTILVTDITVLTITKVFQCLKRTKLLEPLVVNLKYILEMSTDQFYALISEIKNLKEILILVCDDLSDILPFNIKVKELIKTISIKEAVIITNNTYVSLTTQYFPHINEIISDQEHNMEDLHALSQSSILNNTKVIFQGEAVTLANLLGDLPLRLIGGSVLRKIILNESIVIGGSLSNPNYEKMQHLLVARKVTNNQTTREIQSLFDIEDNVVVVTGKPGIGKSTLLTYLALKTKKIDHKWIVKIDFLDCVLNFDKLQKHKTVINRLEVIKFMSLAMLQTIIPAFNKTISLHIDSNGEVHLLDLGEDNEWTTFELRLFLHFYMKTNVIFLFDGFDEISPHYTETVMDFLNVLKDDCCKNKIWITSRVSKSSSLLESSFGTIYELEYFDDSDLYLFLDKFWKTNLIFSHFEKEQIDGVQAFLDNILAVNGSYASILKHPLSSVYKSLILYLVANFPNLDGRDRWRDLYDSMTLTLQQAPVFEEKPSTSRTNSSVVNTPLLAYLSAKWFADYIKQLDDKTNESLSLICPEILYDQFIKTKLLEHFLHNKKVDIYNPSIAREYKEECQKLITLYNN